MQETIECLCPRSCRIVPSANKKPTAPNRQRHADHDQEAFNLHNEGQYSVKYTIDYEFFTVAQLALPTRCSPRSQHQG